MIAMAATFWRITRNWEQSRLFCPNLQCDVTRTRSLIVGQRPLGVFQAEVVIGRMAEFLLAARVTLGGLNRCVAEQELDLLRRAIFLMLARFAAPFTTCQIAFGVLAAPQSFPMRFTRRKIIPALISAATVRVSTARFTHAGTGTVLICFPLPIKSAMTTQWSSRLEIFR